MQSSPVNDIMQWDLIEHWARLCFKLNIMVFDCVISFLFILSHCFPSSTTPWTFILEVSIHLLLLQLVLMNGIIQFTCPLFIVHYLFFTIKMLGQWKWNDTRNNYKCRTERHSTWGYYSEINTDSLALPNPINSTHSSSKAPNMFNALFYLERLMTTISITISFVCLLSRERRYLRFRWDVYWWRT